MNKEIKLHLTPKGFIDLKLTPLIEGFIKERENKAYLLGAWAMWEAVKMERVPRATLKKAKPYEQIFDQSTGWDMAVAEQHRKAQQFIDSLEGRDENKTNPIIRR